MFMFLTVGDVGRVKVFVTRVPPTPIKLSQEPVHSVPIALTSSGAVLALQPLSKDRLLFSRSSFTGPNDVFILRGLDILKHTLGKQPPVIAQADQITRLSDIALQSKALSKGEDFWFKGTDNGDIHGWIFKPKGWKTGERKKWPVLLFIHGGLWICHKFKIIF